MMSRPLKILFLSNRGFLPIKDGHTRRSYNILKGLAERNQVYFLSLYETQEEIDPINIRELEGFCSKVEFHPAPPKKMGLPMLRRLIRSLFSTDPYTIWRHYSKPFLKRVDSLISCEEFDLVHCDILPIAYTVRNKNGILRSITDHDVSYLKCLRIGQGSKNVFLKVFLFFESLKLKRLESQIFRQVDLGIAVSEVDREILQRLCPQGKFFVVENGVDTGKFLPDESQIESNTLLWIGGLNQLPNRQGISYFLEEVYPEIKERMPDVKLEIIGGGVTERLRRMANTDASINLLGYVEDPLPQMQRASVFIAPILSGGGTRLKLLEAMSAGKAIVTTSIGCEGIEGTDGTHFIVADTPKDFAKAIIKIIHDPALRIRLGNSARELTEKIYDWRIITEKLIQGYIQAHLSR
jgi:glycosyltransferase involved in cell wall biosynthesis